MAHVGFHTTMTYLHYVPRENDAALAAAAFATDATVRLRAA